MTLIQYLAEDLKTWSRFYKKEYRLRSFWYLFGKYPEYRVLVKTRLKSFEKTRMGGDSHYKIYGSYNMPKSQFIYLHCS